MFKLKKKVSKKTSKNKTVKSTEELVFTVHYIFSLCKQKKKEFDTIKVYPDFLHVDTSHKQIMIVNW